VSEFPIFKTGKVARSHSAYPNDRHVKLDGYRCLARKDFPHEFSSGFWMALISDLCHLITLSALASTFGEIVTPSWLAVFGLITNANLLGCAISTWLHPISFFYLFIDV
jgi:hypothetical protein